MINKNYLINFKAVYFWKLEVLQNKRASALLHTEAFANNAEQKTKESIEVEKKIEKLLEKKLDNSIVIGTPWKTGLIELSGNKYEDLTAAIRALILIFKEDSFYQKILNGEQNRTNLVKKSKTKKNKKSEILSPVENNVPESKKNNKENE